LARLCRRRPLGIVTGRPRSEALLTLKRLDLDRFFSTLVAAEDTAGRPKPDPRGIRLALKRLGAGRAAYFGDIPDDMAAARAAGVLPVAVFSGPRAARPRWESRMKEAGARIILENLRDCEEAIL
jgi:phosphoglycolate phosphatase-like HAD superfamily hydrolase